MADIPLSLDDPRLTDAQRAAILRLTPSYVTVYLAASNPPRPVLLGFYGQVTPPSDMPVISFPAGKDMAQVTAVLCA
jgi:hypothetical protein